MHRPRRRAPRFSDPEPLQPARRTAARRDDARPYDITYLQLSSHPHNPASQRRSAE